MNQDELEKLVNQNDKKLSLVEQTQGAMGEVLRELKDIAKEQRKELSDIKTILSERKNHEDRIEAIEEVHTKTGCGALALVSLKTDRLEKLVYGALAGVGGLILEQILKTILK